VANVLYINKPKGITSFDVCFKLRKVFGTKKIGHTGTLDPNATGVMIVLLDNATKANQFLVYDSKEYIAKVEIGYLTDTLDVDGNITEQKECTMPSKEEIINVMNSFVGKSKQLPPITSAIKVNGKKLYEYQREGKEVEIPLRDIEVFYIELIDLNESSFTFKTSVSSGTYIRALTRDILDKLGVIGTLTELERTKIDSVTVLECDKLEDILNGEFHDHSLYEVLSRKYETINFIDPRLAVNGRRLKLKTDKEKVLITSDKECIAIYEKDGDEYKCIRGLR